MALGIVTPTKGFPGEALSKAGGAALPPSSSPPPPCLHSRPLPAACSPLSPPDAVALHARHGPLFWWRLLGRRVLMVGGYEPAMQLLKGEYTTGALRCAAPRAALCQRGPAAAAPARLLRWPPAGAHPCRRGQQVGTPPISPLSFPRPCSRGRLSALGARPAGPLGHLQHLWKGARPHQVSPQPPLLHLRWLALAPRPPIASCPPLASARLPCSRPRAAAPPTGPAHARAAAHTLHVLAPAPRPPPCRRLLQAAFTPRALRGYLPRMQASAQAAVRKWAGQGEMQ